MSGLVEVTVVHVSHPNTRSPIRRWIYMILEKNAIPTDLGWIVDNEETLKKILHLAERSKEVENVDAVKVYKIYIPINTYNQLIAGKKREKKKRGVGIAESS